MRSFLPVTDKQPFVWCPSGRPLTAQSVATFLRQSEPQRLAKPLSGRMRRKVRTSSSEMTACPSDRHQHLRNHGHPTERTGANTCVEAIETEDDILISSGTLAETLIVAGRRNLAQEAALLLDGLRLEVVPVTSISAKRIAHIYAQWGDGVHRAGLNFGDCFAYEVARDRACPLLFVGDDFSHTDMIDARSRPNAG
jgi:ribonuclease VapC